MSQKSRSRSKSKQGFRFLDLLKILLLIICILIVSFGGIIATYTVATLKEAPDIDPKNYRKILSETSGVYDKDDQLVERLVQNEYLEFVPLKKIPENMQKAAIAIEDERFYKHSGVDFKRVVSALIYDLKTRSLDQGASTITMQLAKNLYSSHDKTFGRKFKDIYNALHIEHKLSKEEILEGYLNSASYSKGTVGVQAAAKTFFNKEASDLTLAEAALIAGVTQYPTKYTPYTVEAIGPEDDLSAIELSLVPQKETHEITDEEKRWAEYFYENEKIDVYEYSQILSGEYTMGKAVFNPKSKERQEVVLYKMKELGYISPEEYEEAVNQPIQIALGTRKTKGLSSYYVDAVKDEVLAILKEQGHDSEEANDLLYNGGLHISTSLDLDMQNKLQNVVSKDRYFSGNHTDEHGIPQPQVGSVILDQSTGQVRALIGGRGIAGNNILNRAKNPRQPGSSIKPISVYMTALENGITAGDAYNDSPIVKSREFPYAPKNSTGYLGWTTVRKLLVNSSNVGSYKVGKSIGRNDDDSWQKIVDNLENLGITSLVLPDQDKKYNDFNASALCLGGMKYGISPLEMAGGFSAIANHGEYIKPSFVDSITSNIGEKLYEADQTPKVVMSKQNAYILTNMLEDVVRRGTGTYANLPNFHEAGKTGTTNRKRDSWFVGFTPYYTCSVWIGNDDNTPLRDYSRMAARLWRAIMMDAHEGLDDKEFEQPEGIYRKYISGAGYTEIFAEGTEPKNTKRLYRPKPKKDEDDDKDNNNNNNNQESRKRRKRHSNNNGNNNSSSRSKRNEEENN